MLKVFISCLSFGAGKNALKVSSYLEMQSKRYLAFLKNKRCKDEMMIQKICNQKVDNKVENFKILIFFIPLPFLKIIFAQSLQDRRKSRNFFQIRLYLYVSNHTSHFVRRRFFFNRRHRINCNFWEFYRKFRKLALNFVKRTVVITKHLNQASQFFSKQHYELHMHRVFW